MFIQKNTYVGGLGYFQYPWRSQNFRISVLAAGSHKFFGFHFLKDNLFMQIVSKKSFFAICFLNLFESKKLKFGKRDNKKHFQFQKFLNVQLFREFFVVEILTSEDEHL